MKCCNKETILIEDSNDDDSKIYRCYNCGSFHNELIKKEFENSIYGNWIVPIIKEEKQSEEAK